MRVGCRGTELAPMSTTSSLRTAVDYSMSKRSLIFCIRTKNKLERGVNLEWISAFSRESETLFPPLTYLQPTGRTQVGCRYFPVTYCYWWIPLPLTRALWLWQEIEVGGMHFTIVEVTATIA